MGLKILYEDNHLLAVFKPAGVLVQGDKTGDPCLMDEAKAYLKDKYKKPGQVFLGLLHRLDRPVQGIVLFARTSKGASRLSEQFRKHTIRKKYQALVVGRPRQSQGTLIHYLKKDEALNKTAAFDREVPGSLYAELSYAVKESKGRYTLVEIELKTGRPHQIRCQFSAIGCPVAGDVKYGAPAALPNKSIALAAVSLSFETATTHEPVTLTVEPQFLTE